MANYSSKTNHTSEIIVTFASDYGQKNMFYSDCLATYFGKHNGTRSYQSRGSCG